MGNTLTPVQNNFHVKTFIFSLSDRHGDSPPFRENGSCCQADLLPPVGSVHWGPAR